jgi:hypothetical protein
VNVLLGYDRSSGLPVSGCPSQNDASTAGSQLHNLAWTRLMGRGITIYNSIGHEDGTFTANGNAGDSLLWRFIRYAAKDWCVAGSGTPGCDATTAVRAAESVPEALPLQGNGAVSLPLPGPGRYTVTLTDLGGRVVAAQSVAGQAKLDVSGLRRGLHLARIDGEGGTSTRRIMVF